MPCNGMTLKNTNTCEHLLWLGPSAQIVSWPTWPLLALRGVTEGGAHKGGKQEKRCCAHRHAFVAAACVLAAEVCVQCVRREIPDLMHSLASAQAIAAGRA